MIGSMFAHQKKETETYHAFVSSLLGMKLLLLKDLKCIGTNGETSLSPWFQLAFSNNVNMFFASSI